MFFQACQIHPGHPSDHPSLASVGEIPLTISGESNTACRCLRERKRSVTIPFRQLHVAVIFQVLYQPLAAIGHLVE